MLSLCVVSRRLWWGSEYRYTQRSVYPTGSVCRCLLLQGDLWLLHTARTCTTPHAHIHTLTHAHTNSHTRMNTHIHANAHTHTHADTHTRKRTYTHTHTTKQHYLAAYISSKGALLLLSIYLSVGPVIKLNTVDDIYS